MNQEGMFKPAVIGGVLLGILSALPFVNLMNCFCCAWVIAGGVLAAHLYVRNSPTVVTLGQGIVLGLLTGIIGAAVDILFSIPVRIMLAGVGSGFMQQFLDQIPNLPPEMKEQMRTALSGTVGIASWIFSGFLILVVYALIGMLGGAIGVALFEKRKPPATAAEIYQPPTVPPPSQPPTAPPPPPIQ